MVGKRMRSFSIAVAALVLALGVAACGSGGDGGNRTGPAAATSTETSPPTIGFPASSELLSPNESPSTTTSARPLTQAGVICDLVVAANQKTVPVVVYSGAVDCVEALEVARTYFADAPQKAQGSGGFLTVNGWSCGRAFVEGRSGAESPTECTSPDGLSSIRLGT